MSVPVLRTVDRALQLIELLRVHSEVTVSGAAEVLGVGTSVVHRLLATLEARGFARRAADSRAYCLGPALLALRPESSDADYIAIAQDQLRQLQAATGETVHLAALHGRNVRFFYTIVSRHTMRVESRVGDLLPAHAASAGRALLATLPVVALRKLYPEPTLLTVGRTSTPTREALETELEAVRRRGYARNVEDTEPGVAALAMAVHGPARMPPIAVTVAGPQARLLLERDDTETATERELSATLRRSVRAIQARLSPAG
ncbi:IclR family transcriptional regulator [Pseudonocardia acaciae]|uniref:IclR family transcriptional regulator n=1 Tax=Pseudonocardia acaciae TaxID=551276 RepID=UPI00055EEF8B|nr:IclR family transcriptional regulator [Pseudonocardia acaciae]